MTYILYQTHMLLCTDKDPYPQLNLLIHLAITKTDKDNLIATLIAATYILYYITLYVTFLAFLNHIIISS